MSKERKKCKYCGRRSGCGVCSNCKEKLVLIRQLRAMTAPLREYIAERELNKK